MTDECACHGRPLLLSARQLARATIQDIVDLEHLGNLADAPLHLATTVASEREGEADVLADGQMRVQRVAL